MGFFISKFLSQLIYPLSLGIFTALAGLTARQSRKSAKVSRLVAPGGIRSAQDAQAMIAAGATRLGASAGIKILKEAAGGPK